MKALSIRQPWAWLIVNGYKDIENRDWSTKFRGVFGVHTGKKLDASGYDYVRRAFPEIPLPAPHQLEVGGIVGEATLTDCVEDHPSRFFEGIYGFVLADAKPLPFQPLRGQLGFFEVPAPVSAGGSRDG